MVAINGPLALAAQLAEDDMRTDPTQGTALEGFAAEVTLSVSKAFVEAGADVVVMRERWPSPRSRNP